MKTINLFIIPVLVFAFIFAGPSLSLVSAATTDFTASGNVTVGDITVGGTTSTLLIFSDSTAESISVSGGVLTVTNPAATFQIGSAEAVVRSIKVIRQTNYSLECVDNTTPGTSSITLSADTSDFTVTAQTTLCGGSGNSGSGGSSGGGGGGGAGAPTPPAGGSDIGGLGTSGKDALVSLNINTTFNTSVSGGGAGNHTVKATIINLTTQRATLVFQSDPVTIELGVGEIKKVDLNADGTNDISVKLNSLTADKVSLTLTDITSASGPLPEQALKSGDLIKTAASSAVYYVGNDNKRHLFSNEVTFWTWYTGSWSKIMHGTATKAVQVISQSDFDKLALGDNIIVKPSSKLIKFENSPRVYVVIKGGKIRQVVSSSGDASVAKSLYGTGYKTKTILIQNAFENNYTRDTALTTDSVAPTETAEINELY